MIRKRGRRKKRVCQCCADKVTTVDYKDISKLRRYVSERGKILPRRITGNCAKLFLFFSGKAGKAVKKVVDKPCFV